MRGLFFVVPWVACLATAALGAGCHKTEGDRRAAATATAVAEERARETTITAAHVEPAETARANDEVIGAFRLEQSDFRSRLQRELDMLDKQDGSGPRRGLLLSDLDALNRSTEPDWATVRTKLERDLDAVEGPP